MAESSVTSHEAQPDSAVIRVVVADDQPLIRAGLRLLLDAEDDLEVVGEAADGMEAIELARRLAPDVVVMDIRMPHVDGLEATRTIVADPSLASVKVVVLTTFDLDEYVFEAIRSGATGFLLKDSEPTDSCVRCASPNRRSAGVAERDAPPDRGVRRPPEHRTVDADALDELTDREREVVALVAGGMNNDEIADTLFISPATARTHVSRAMTKSVPETAPSWWSSRTSPASSRPCMVRDMLRFARLLPPDAHDVVPRAVRDGDATVRIARWSHDTTCHSHRTKSGRRPRRRCHQDVRDRRSAVRALDDVHVDIPAAHSPRSWARRAPGSRR